ncbi:MAG: hypothetical protein V3V33_05345 [Candidatus Lokiarchaeia archaeon]
MISDSNDSIFFKNPFFFYLFWGHTIKPTLKISFKVRRIPRFLENANDEVDIRKLLEKKGYY